MNKFKSVYKEGSRYLPFLLSIVFINLGFGIQKGVLDNYLAEVGRVDELGRGIIEFFREMPGLALVLILALFASCSAERFYKVGGVIIISGMVMMSLVPPQMGLVIMAIFVFSLGEHIQLGMKSTLSLGYAREGHGGGALGLQSTVEHTGTISGLLIMAVALRFIPSGEKTYRAFFLVAAACVLAGTLISFRIQGNSSTDEHKSRFYFRKKYRKYYFLEVFYGARKQVFFTFGPYVLILFYKASAATISMLYVISSLACLLAAPLVGKIIDRAGYRIVMIMDTVILVAVCFFYGFAHHIFPKDIAFLVCCVNYILDSVISLASMASNVYVQDLSDNEDEMKATIATGVSVNHLITVFIALFGGWVWQKLGIEVLFIVSAVLGLCNSAYAATIRMKDGHALRD